jgi:hypothetical protein
MVAVIWFLILVKAINSYLDVNQFDFLSDALLSSLKENVKS